MAWFVPPGGFSGFSQMTPASRAALTPRGSGSRTRGRKKRKKTSTRKRAKSSKRKLKFGSPAWRKKYAPKKKRK